MINLKNKKILITGATGGIGYSLVKKFYESGSVILATGTNQDKLDKLKKEFQNISIKNFKLNEHLKIEEFINSCYEDLGGLDVLINNAGITSDNLSIRLVDENWKKVIDINLTSTFLMCKHSIKKMLKNKYGKIINITSIVGHTGNAGQANYAASKAGIVGFSKSLAIEYAKKKININCISPGFIKTEMTDRINEDFRIDDKSYLELKKFDFDRLHLKRSNNYKTWKKFCTHNSIQIINRKIQKKTLK